MKQFFRSKRSARAVAALAMAAVFAVGGVGTIGLLESQPDALTVAAVAQPEPSKAKKAKKVECAASSAEETAVPETETVEEAAEDTAEESAVPASGTAQAELPVQSAQLVQEEETVQPEVPAAAEAAEPEVEPAPAEDVGTENSVVMLQEETPELAAQDPQAPAADGTPENDTSDQHTPEGSMLLTPEEIQAALDAGALDEAEAQCIDLSDENGFFAWLWNWLFGKKTDTTPTPTPAPTYSGWRTENGKTYYYSQSTNKKVTGIQSIDGKLYYFDANGVMQNNVTFGIDVSKYQSSGINWDKIKKSGVSFVIIRIGYRGYGAAGTLVKDPMFEEHFTNARNAGLKVGVYFFTQAVNEAEAREEADACNWALNGRQLDYPIFYDTEASSSSNGTGRADGLGVEDRTKCAIAFCEEVKALGYQPGVYASTTWYRKRVDYNTLRSRYTIWNAHYGVSSSPIGCDLWQGTEKARINGYNGELDANISYIG